MIASSQSISSAQTWRAMLALFIFKVKFIEKVRWLLTFEIIMCETEKKKIFEAKRLAPSASSAIRNIGRGRPSLEMYAEMFNIIMSWPGQKDCTKLLDTKLIWKTKRFGASFPMRECH